MNEFQLIDRIFKSSELCCANTKPILGIGDDCSIIEISTSHIAQSIDTVIEGVHFPKNIDPYILGYRALVVCVSDLAAMGAIPHSFMLALTLPDNNENWLISFSHGLLRAAKEFKISLIGGDTTKGSLSISIQVQGLLPCNKALRRANSQIGDLIYVSGNLGDAAGALPFILNSKDHQFHNMDIQYLVDRFFFPTPQVLLGQWLLDSGAHAAIDISDGLISDLQHILTASGVGAVIDATKIPISQALSNTYASNAQKMAMSGGDDYELCFTWPYSKPLNLPESLQVKLSCIGNIISDQACRVIDQSNNQPIVNEEGYKHF